ncbi:MAG: division/cell wall cluster transcriptional repressor MraZ [Ignavibacteriaceae bacterium]|nr:division/cell wall cluster transcriptional repressor MraZ [Ignavibacteriaceae bacterium]
MFQGTYRHTIDAKGRVAIPAKLRKVIAPEAENTLVLTRGSNSCISVYPRDIWNNKIVTKLKTLNEYNQNDNRVLRYLSHNADEEEMDGQSRIIVPKFLLEHAQIKDDILIMGTIEKIEFWDPVVYAEYERSSAVAYDELIEQVLKS